MCVCCEGDGNAGVVFGGGVVVDSECMSGTHGSGVLSSTGDVLEMSVVRGLGGVCYMCMCLARAGMGGERGEWMRELGLGFTNPVGTGAGCAFSGRPLARGDWKCWWTIGKHFNGRPPGEWK